MGTWGVKLYQDDVTEEIKELYLQRLRMGYDNNKATDDLIKICNDYINDYDDCPLFWFALADTQWKYGRLLPKVKKQAIKYIDNGQNLDRWKESKLYDKRNKVLIDLKKQLNSPQPPEKKVKKEKPYITPWKTGDILCYKLHDTRTLSSSWNDKYVLLEIIGKEIYKKWSMPDEYTSYVSVAKVYNWYGKEKPTLDQIKKMKYAKTKEGGLLTEIEFSMGFTFSNYQINKKGIEVLYNINSSLDEKYIEDATLILNYRNIDNYIIYQFETYN